MRISKLELFILIACGFILFELIFIRIGFLLGSPIGSFTFILSLIIYTVSAAFLFAMTPLPQMRKSDSYQSLFAFLLCVAIFATFSLPLAQTYDTSWDGQGYHQTAVIGLANGWNPLWEPELALGKRLPSQIFAEGYPSALWEIEASIYALTGRINAAKVPTLFIGLLAALIAYSLLRKLNLGKTLASILSALVVLQPVYVLQLLTFMGDGFGYELIVIAAATLTISILRPKDSWAIGIFWFAELLLVSTKYSHLPVALILGFIFLLVFTNRLLNHDYQITHKAKLWFFGILLLLIVGIFALLPYGRNAIFHGALFYPTNITELMGSVKYNNVPLNLNDKDKFSLLLYGIFSEAQTIESGDPRNKENIAELKIPFTFSLKELRDSAGLYNNRVGSGGPLFSGIVLLTILFLVFVSIRAETKKERYALYISYFALTFLLGLALVTPTPNLLRYANQLQLIPFVIILPLYVIFKDRYVKLVTGMVILLVAINTLFYTTAVIQQKIRETNAINQQFTAMRNSENTYHVRAQEFYSSYIILSEQKVSFYTVDKMLCRDIEELVASSTTTQYCKK